MVTSLKPVGVTIDTNPRNGISCICVKVSSERML